jgi:hypothetical protein
MKTKFKKPFKTLCGQRVIIAPDFIEEKQEEQKPSIELIGSAKAEVEEEKLAQTQRFTILQLGSDCNKDIFKEGDQVYIESPERVLHPQNSVTIIEEGKILGFIIPERQIAGVFE